MYFKGMQGFQEVGLPLLESQTKDAGGKTAEKGRGDPAVGAGRNSDGQERGTAAAEEKEVKIMTDPKKVFQALIMCRTKCSLDAYNLIKQMQKENKALRQLLDWAVECDFGYDNLGNWWVDRIKGEIEGMGYTEGLIHLAKRYMEIFGEEDEDG